MCPTVQSAASPRPTCLVAGVAPCTEKQFITLDSAYETEDWETYEAFMDDLISSNPGCYGCINDCNDGGLQECLTLISNDENIKDCYDGPGGIVDGGLQECSVSCAGLARTPIRRPIPRLPSLQRKPLLPCTILLLRLLFGRD